MLTFLNSRAKKKHLSAQHEKEFKKNALVDTRPDLYLLLRFLCVPLEEAHVPLVVRVPHFENHWCRAYGCLSVSVGLIFPLFLLVVWICRLELATHHGASCACQHNPPLAVRYYELWRSEWLRDIREDIVLQMQHVLDRAELGGCV